MPRRAAIALLSACLPAASAACTFEPDPADVYDGWLEEAEAHGPTGVDASFRFTGAPSLPVFVEGDLEGPFLFEAGLTLLDAEVPGVGTGRLELQPGARASGGLVVDARGSSVSLGAGGGALLVLDRVDASYEYEVRDLALDAAAWTFTPYGDDVVPISSDEGLFVAAAKALLAEVPFEVPSRSGHLDVLALGGAVSGSVDLEGDVVEGAIAVYGRDADVTFGEGALAGEARVTQVLTGEAVAIPASLEVIAFSPEETVEVGRRVEVVFGYREAGFRGDAVVTGFEVVGPLQEHVSVAVSPPEGAVASLLQSVEDAGPAAPIVAIAVIPVLPFVAIGDALASFFGSSGPEPDPIPSWIDAGRVGRFSVVLDAEVEPGEHDLVVRVDGANFDPVEVSARVVVREEEDD